MIIRKELISDYHQVNELVIKSFSTVGYEGEAEYLKEVREKDEFIPELSLVAQSEQGQIVGQIVLYETELICKEQIHTELVLSPLCVDPDNFGKGIARRLIATGVENARKLGYSAVFLCGDPKFYSKFGFKPSYEYGIFHSKHIEEQPPWCMALEIKKGALKEKTGQINIV